MKAPIKQYYNVALESPFIYDDNKKITVSSIKELDTYINEQIKCYIHDYFNFRRRPIHQDDDDIFKTVKKIYKRIQKSFMFRDTEKSVSNAGGAKRVGKTYTVNYLSKNNEIELLLCLWCERINKKDLIEYAGFKELEQ
jgi:hypothetical protein